MEHLGRNILIWISVGLFLVFSFSFFQEHQRAEKIESVAYSVFLSSIEEGKVRDVTIRGNEIQGHWTDGREFSTYAPQDPLLITRLEKKNILINAGPPHEASPGLLDILISWFPMLLLIGVWVFLLYQMQSGGGKALGFGRSKARLLTEKHDKITFDDVAGIDEAKEELQEIVDFLKEPQKFQKLGGKIPKGALLIGPPGTGKTLLARAVAGEANVPFFTISGSDFVEMFVGVGASRVRDMFEQGKKSTPCIIFIDEIDAVGRHRGAGLGGGNDEREQTLNQLLVEMDGFGSYQGIVLIAATNRPDVLDPALLRPGRFDRQIIVPNPDIAGREKILQVHAAKVALAPNVDLKTVARGTPGFSGADLANLVNEAALLAAKHNKKLVTMHEMEEAKDKVLMGSQRRSMVMSEQEKELTAYHEAGHALVGIHVKGNDPLHKVTIIPRGRALGVTMNLPEKDRYSETKSQIKARIAMIFGGRIAEEIVFGADNVTSGAANDIMQATRHARTMVTKYGMSHKLGPLRYAEDEEEVFLGHSVARRKNMSDETAHMIDEEVRRIVNKGQETARFVLKKYRAQLNLLAKSLLEHETLSGDDVRTLIKSGKMPPPPAAPNKQDIHSSVPESGPNTTTASKPSPKKA